jgi:hypothetical protein
VLVSVSLLPIMVLASYDFGVTWDEKARHQYGEHIWEFYRGLRSRSAFVEDGGHLYGGLFDVICVAVERWLPVNRYVLRHAINAVFGWIGVVYSGRLAARLFGTWSGVLAMVLLAASPRYFADSMNNPKDLPFAAMTVAALYYFSTVSSTWPYLSRATAIKIAVTLALALNIRPGALLYLGYLGMLVAAFAIVEGNMTWRRMADTAARLATVAAAVLLLGTLFWPWAQAAPLTRPFQALLGVASYGGYEGGVLFNGHDYEPDQLPRYYVPEWLLISTPPVVIAGAILSVFVSRTRRWTLSRNALWAAAVFPVLLSIFIGSTLYDGVRHLLFIYPVLVVLAASGWTAWLSGRDRSWLRRSAAALLLAAGLVHTIASIVRFHPHQTVYFNELVGGPRGAFAKFDLDYWGNCFLDAIAWSAQTARLSGRPIVISGFPPHLVADNVERFPQLLFTPPPERKHSLTVRLNRGLAKEVAALANDRRALYRVQTADGAVLCVVMPGPAFAELQPHLALPPGSRHTGPTDARSLDFGAAGDR